MDRPGPSRRATCSVARLAAIHRRPVRTTERARLSCSSPAPGSRCRRWRKDQASAAIANEMDEAQVDPRHLGQRMGTAGQLRGIDHDRPARDLPDRAQQAARVPRIGVAVAFGYTGQEGLAATLQPAIAGQRVRLVHGPGPAGQDLAPHRAGLDRGTAGAPLIAGLGGTGQPEQLPRPHDRRGLAQHDVQQRRAAVPIAGDVEQRLEAFGHCATPGSNAAVTARLPLPSRHASTGASISRLQITAQA